MRKSVFRNFAKKKTTLTSKREAGKVFNPFFEALADIAFEHIEEEVDVSKILNGSLSEVLDRNILVELLFKVSKRVLIGDLNVRREMGDLNGETEEAQYADYVFRYLTDPAYLEQLFREYPAWEETLFQTMEYFVRNIKELIQHFDTDKDCLNAEFFSKEKFDKIRRIAGSGSDTHCENRIVYGVELDNGKRIYHKSRVNTGVLFFNELYTQICASLDLEAGIQPVLMGSDYVWEKEVLYAECENEQQVQNYFVRLGILLSICHLCHGGDMHYENMIASGEFPVIIDYETLVQLPPDEMPEGTKKASQIIGESVLPIGILPFYGSRSQNFNADFSGLCGGGKQIMDIRIPIIENPGKSTMCIAYKYGETGDKHNRVRLNGELVQPENYIDHLYRGYEAGYRYVLSHRKNVLEMTKHMKEAIFRQLFRNTQEYHMILDLSYHPEFMRELGARRDFLENALSTPLFADRPEILKQEISDMLKGDVPYFQFHMSSGDILNSERKPVQTYFKKTGMEFLKNQIQNRSEDDLKLQKYFIEVSLRYKQVENLRALYEQAELFDENAYEGNSEEQSEHILDLCHQIADRICEDHMCVDGQTLWMNTRIMTTGVDKRHTYFMELSDRYLYEGTMGMAVFMAAFLKYDPDHKIRCLYEKIVEDLFDYTDLMEAEPAKMHEDKISGAFLGEGSILYGYQLLYAITGDVNYLKYARKHSSVLAAIVEQDNQFDLVGGNAGAILTCLNMYDLQKDSIYLDMAKKAGDYLIAHAVSVDIQGTEGIGWPNISNDGLLGGFAHGCAGIMYALARLSAYAKEEKYLDVAYQAFAYERTMNHPEYGGFRDYRSKEPYYMGDFKWCHGVAGIVLGWHLASDYFDDVRKNEIRREIRKVTEDYPDILIKEELGLCHGNYGNDLIGHLTEVNVWKKSMRRNKARSLYVLEKNLSERERNVRLHEHYDYSLMTGWAGIGYELLWNVSNDLPAILNVHVMDIQN